MVRYNCSSCVWISERDPVDDHEYRCPECGGDLDVDADHQDIADAETRTDKL